MIATATRHRGSVTDPANTALSADIEVIGRAARVSFHVPGGHVSEQDQRRLVGAVLADPRLASVDQLEITLPLGNPVLLAAVEERCRPELIRAAGATCLIDSRIHRER